ncbi:hypothetical protein [Pseudophaeobacter flagellatus]|uniref:hypothetical protein n=1 Tax=Pseudophaeobacter flagellatus TaxID=2899119 RepID=UPI001E4A07A4|nr:hypothetical protein [Pseudophaeobacter flagellatus]MCD9148983.1 hypothetical protein [Pseudophaeobacter flagellatus]
MMGTKYFSDASGAYLGAFVDGVQPPAGAIERDCPPKSAAALWLDGNWIEPDPRDGLRAVASLSRQAFCLALFREGILTEADAIAAARGDWPTALSDVLATLPSDAAAEARIVWATSTEVRRLHPLLAMIATHMGIDDLGLDAIFGLSVQGAGE